MKKKKKEVNYIVLERFGKHLAKIREEKGMTQEDLAYEAGLAVSQVSRIESGMNTTVHSLFLICSALNISIQDFFKDFKVK